MGFIKGKDCNTNADFNNEKSCNFKRRNRRAKCIFKKGKEKREVNINLTYS